MAEGYLSALVESNLDISSYGTVFIGYPVWATEAPQAVFYAQTDNPVLSVNVIPIGRVTSDLSVFEHFDSREEVTFSLAE